MLDDAYRAGLEKGKEKTAHDIYSMCQNFFSQAWNFDSFEVAMKSKYPELFPISLDIQA